MIKRADVLDQDGLVSFEEFYTIVTRKIKEWFVVIVALYLIKEYENNTN